ncbi:hypothetical protein ACOSP7_012007 [Xanthoceras sorbifolium]
MVVWLAAERVYPGSGKFKAYATLGDDVVIADSRVAKEYQEASALGGNGCRDFGSERTELGRASPHSKKQTGRLKGKLKSKSLR